MGVRFILNYIKNTIKNDNSTKLLNLLIYGRRARTENFLSTIYKNETSYLGNFAIKVSDYLYYKKECPNTVYKTIESNIIVENKS